MVTIVDAKNLADLYDLPPVDWAAITARLDLGVTQAPDRRTGSPRAGWPRSADGSPRHGDRRDVADGTFWFETGERTRKARNLARDPRCTLSVAMREFDLVVEGAPIGSPILRPLPPWPNAGPQRAGRVGVDETGRALTAEYSAPSAGPPPWFVYRITPRSATALAILEAGGATRWRFVI
jgi:hypothetical protein